MSLVKANNLGTLQHNRERDIRNQIIERYENVGVQYKTETVLNESTGQQEQVQVKVKDGFNWLEGLKGQVKTNVALLYENQAQHLMTEATTSQSSGSFEVVAFPMVRRVFSRLLSNELVSVQAMTQPSGTLFYYYPKISNRVEKTDEDGNVIGYGHTSPHSKNTATCLGANCPDTTYEQFKSLYDMYYDDALYDHSKGSFDLITSTGTPVTLNNNGQAVPATSLALSTDGSIREVKFGVVGFDGKNSGDRKGHTARLTGHNRGEEDVFSGKGYEIDTEEFLSSFTVLNAGDPIRTPDGTVIYNTGDAVDYRFVAQRYGKSIVDYENLCDANGTLLIEIDLKTPNEDVDNPTYDDYIGAASGTTFTDTQFVFTWRRYEDLEFETEMGEVSFELKKVTLSVLPRKLRARWSPELAQDVQAYHNIDAEAELTALLSEQIAMEIDREVLRDLKNGAAWQARWNWTGWKKQGSQKYTQKEWNQTLVTKINQVSAQIHKSTLRGGANFIVVSTEVSAIFDDLENFMVSSAAPADDKYNLGIRRVGTLSGRFTVYVDPYSPANQILIGHKGSSLLDTGYILAPYLVAQLTPTLTDHNNFTNVKGISSRYATKMVNNRYYGKIKVDNVFTFDTREFR